MKRKRKKLTFSHKLTMWVVGYYFVFTAAIGAGICLIDGAATPLLALFTAFSAAPAAVILSYFKKARIENVEKINLNPQCEDEGEDV